MSSKAKDDDLAPAEYPYLWSSKSEISLDDFLKKYKPSMVQDDGTKPWIWIRGSPEAPSTEAPEAISDAINEAGELLGKVTARIEEIKNDDSIPMRSSKKTGAKNKKEVRELEQAEAAANLKEISQKHGYVSGKWLIFAMGDKVDIIWSNLAHSLANGPLSKTTAWLAKVATCPRIETPNYQHVMCLYMPNVYDKEAVIKVMKILLRNHGMNLSGVKSNLYTSIGLDSKHPSGIQSTVWKNTALMKDTEIKELKDAYYAEAATNKPKEVPSEATTGADRATEKRAAQPTKAKLQPKKKVVEDDPFASDDDKTDEKKSTGKIKRPVDKSDASEEPKAKRRKGS